MKVAKLGFMSRGLQLKDLVANLQGNSEEPQPHHERAISTPFCVCGFCREMPTDKEACVARKKGYAGASQWFLETFVWILTI